MPSQVSICNMALSRFGNVSIADINENTRESRACKTVWDLTRDTLVESYPWRFAIKRHAFGSYLSDVPAFPEDTYYYEIPSDCLRVLDLWQDGTMTDAEWNIEGNKLICGLDSDLQIRYIAKITDASQFSNAFAASMVCALAAELAPKLTDDPKLRVSHLQELQTSISKAYKLNAIEGNPPHHKDEQALDAGNFSWQTEGR